MSSNVIIVTGNAANAAYPRASNPAAYHTTTSNENIAIKITHFRCSFIATIDSIDVVRVLEEDARRSVLRAASETSESAARYRFLVVDDECLCVVE